jgi:ABC-type lipoprotein release transport system permease subunit
MRLYLRLAWRNIWRHKRRTIIIVVALAMCMWLMMFYDGLLTGFTDAIYGNAVKILGGNIQVHEAGYSENSVTNPIMPLNDDQQIAAYALTLPNVVGASRRIETDGLATSREGSFGVSIIGIEPELEAPLSVLSKNVVSGKYLESGDGDSVFIGKGLADELNVQVGEKFTLVGRDAHNQVRKRTMTVGGIYDVSMPELEKGIVYMSLPEAQQLYDLTGKSTMVMVTLANIGREKPVIAGITQQFPGSDIGSWQTKYPELTSAITTKSGAMNIFGFVIILIAGIGILNMLLMAVYERTREIGFLGAMGIRPGGINLLFLLEGALIGLVGIAAGILFGLVFNFLFQQVGLDFSKFSTVTTYAALISGRVYPSLGLEKIVGRVLVMLIVSIAAAFYPAWEASHREPAEALHYV